MSTIAIRRIISAARTRELETRALWRHFQQRSETLSRQLHLPSEDPAAALVDFVSEYVAHVPEFIEKLADDSSREGLYEQVAPFLNMAEDFFLAPPEGLEQQGDLLQLLDEAFLAHRLIEELNDRHILLRRSQLLPIEMTRANIIVHHLLGDSLANRLNRLVEEGVRLLLDKEQLFKQIQNSEEAETSLLAIWQSLPCLGRKSEVDLRF